MPVCVGRLALEGFSNGLIIFPYTLRVGAVLARRMRNSSILGNTMKFGNNLGFPQRLTDLSWLNNGRDVVSRPIEAGVLFLAAQIARVISVFDVIRGEL